MNETACCTDDSDTTSGAREVGCAPEMHQALENSHHTTAPHTCIPKHITQCCNAAEQFHDLLHPPLSPQ